jgi:Predicted xylanase/chitin deacetylase
MNYKPGFCFCLIVLAAGFIGSEMLSSLADSNQIIRKVPTSHKVVALTFDDGPSKKTPTILEILKEKHVKATFFVLGERVEKFPQYIVKEIQDGHEIGNHGYSHEPLLLANKSKIDDEIERTDTLLMQMSGKKPEFFRPPGGAYNHLVLEEAQRMEHTIVLWSVDSRDWASSGEKIIRTILSNIRPGSIVLLHDGIEPIPTSKVLPVVIDRLREQGYEFVTVGELLQYYEERSKLSVN